MIEIKRSTLILLLLLAGCTPRINVLVWEDLENGQYHVVGIKSNDQYSDVIKLPPGTKEGDIVKIKIKKEDL